MTKEKNLTVKALNLWPTRVWSFEFSEAKDFQENWTANLIDRREIDPEKKPSFSNRQGWNSKKDLFADENFHQLKLFANAAFARVFNEMKLAGNFKFRLEAWANIHDEGGFNYAHVHRNVLLSGCYYMRVPERAGPIVFKDPRPGPLFAGLHGQGINCYGEHKIKPPEGSLLIFPNWLEHSVEVNESDAQRVSIAMNAIAVSK